MKHRSLDPAGLHDHIDERMMINDLRTGFEQQVFHRQHGFVFGDHACGGIFIKRDFPIDFIGTVKPHLAAPVHVNGPVQRPVVHVAAHERSDFAENGHAAEAAVAFDDEGFDPVPGGHDSGADSARAAPDHQYFGFRNDRNFLIDLILDCFHGDYLLC